MIVVDFPDPTNFSIGKLYTTSFYALVDQHLLAGGYAVVQTTSPLIARKQLLDRRDDDRGGRPHGVTPYHAHVPSFGEWGFIIASRRPFAHADGACPPGLRFLDRCRPAGAVRVSARHGARAGRGRTACRTRCWCRPSRKNGASVQPMTRADRRGARGAAARWRARWRLARRTTQRRVTSAAGSARTPSAATACATPRHGAPASRRCSIAAACIVVGAGVAGLRGGARADARRRRRRASARPRGRAPAATAAATRSPACACPLGAHYLPVPGEAAIEVHRAARRARPAPRSSTAGRSTTSASLCHSPQERLFIDGHWHEGLLPPVEALPLPSAPRRWPQYRRFAPPSTRAGRARRRFAIPTARSRWSAGTGALDAMTFAALARRAAVCARRRLRWYLDYCCRDDYGAGAAQVSAWAGLHYFASRHGFHAPGDDGATSATAC